MTDYTVIHDAAELLDPTGSTVTRIADAAVAISEGTIVASGSTDAVTHEFPPENAAGAIDASGKVVLPGFVDSHTHAVFAGDRSEEFTAKLEGKSYQEIRNEGGGILRTVEAVRAASMAELVEGLLARLDQMVAHGTTTVEVKSGYGLSVEAERKLLEAIDVAADRHPLDVVSTFMGAHDVPAGSDTDEYVETVIDDQLPAVADLAEFCDVFCEAGVFTTEQSRRVLEAGADAGLTPKVHAEEFERIGGARVAADVEAASADHLLQATAEDAEALAAADVTPVLLPGTAFTLDTEYADPTLFEEVAIATDFNPNCHSMSMEFAVDLACHGMRMAPDTALRSATAVAAKALDRTNGIGTLQVGAPGDVIISSVSSVDQIPYNFGISTIETVLKDGEVVYHD